MKPKIVVIGSANTDMVVQVKRLPAPGETVLGGVFMTAQGGKGANQAVAAARLGADITFIARLGRDAFGEQSLAAYKHEGLDTRYISLDDETPSGVALITVNTRGENMITVAPGANYKLSPADITAAEPAIRQADCILIQLEIPLATASAAISLAHHHGVRVLLNPAPAQRLPDESLRNVDFLTPNKKELAQLVEKEIPVSEAAKQLLQKGVHAVIVTLGSEGAYIASSTEQRIAPAYQVSSIDTTAAGDAFNGALAFALASGKPLETAVNFANAAGALTTTRMGAQPSLPTYREVTEFLATMQPTL